MKRKLLCFTMITLAISTASHAGVYKGEGGFSNPGAYQTQSSTCYNSGNNRANMLKDGIYVGVGAGYDSYRVRASVNANDGLGDNIQSNTTVNPAGFMGGVFLGWGRYLTNYFYLGGELFGDFSKATVSENDTFTDPDTTIVYTGKISSKGAFGINFHPGFALTPSTLLFVRLGYIRGGFRTQETSTGLSINNNSTNWVNGFDYGIGVETSLCDNFSLRSEFTHSNFKSFTINSTNTRYSPSNNQYKMDLVFHFA